MDPRPLPDAARHLCERLAAPPRLVAHLTLVHDVAVDLLRALGERFPALDLDNDAILFGAATHDLGKAIHTAELAAPGKRHETDGPSLLEREGISPDLARFARTHGFGHDEDGLAPEDLLVALADSAWKGQRDDELETRLAAEIARRTQDEPWSVYSALDEIIEQLAADAEERLAWQATSRE